MTPDILEQMEIDSFPEWTKLVCMCVVCGYVHVNIMWVGMCVCGYIIFTTIIYSINLIMYPLILIIIH